MSNRAIDRVGRMLALLAYLSDKPDGVTVHDAARHLDITTSDALADARNLASFCALPGQFGGDFIDIDISGDTGGARLRLINAQGLDRPLRLTADEGMALTVAARSLSLIPGVASAEVLESAIEVLEQAAVPGRDANVAVGIAVGIADNTPPASSEVADAIARAVADQRAVRVTHLSGARDEVTERTLDPVNVLRRGGHTYLRAWCRKAQGMRTFRTDRIISATVLDEKSVPQGAPEPGPDLEVFVAGPTQPDLPVTTVVLSPARNWQADYLPHLAKTFAPDGSVSLQVAVSDDGWATRLVLAGGGEVRLPERPDLERAAAETAQMALSNYSDGPHLGH